MFEVTVTREFSAAHFLREYGGKCAKLHGHNWKVAVAFRSAQLEKNGILIDFLEIGKALDGLLEQLDHGVINEIPPFDAESPTSERLAQWFFEEIHRRMPENTPKPHRVTVWETLDASASFWETKS